MKTYNNTDEGNKVAKKMLYFLLFAILPFLWIFFTYINNPESTTLNVIASSTSNLPAVLSANNPLLSKVMDVYTKTAPLFAFILFLSSVKGMHIRSDKKTTVLLTNLILYCVFCLIFTYVFLFCNIELTTSGRLLRIMSSNVVTLSIFYITLYSGIYILLSMLFWFSIGVCKILKERW